MEIIGRLVSPASIPCPHPCHLGQYGDIVRGLESGQLNLGFIRPVENIGSLRFVSIAHERYHLAVAWNKEDPTASRDAIVDIARSLARGWRAASGPNCSERVRSPSTSPPPGGSYAEADALDATLDGVRRRAILRTTGLTPTGADGVRPNWAACVIEEDTKSASISGGSMRG